MSITTIVIFLLGLPSLNTIPRNPWKIEQSTTEELVRTCNVSGTTYDECRRECSCRTGELEDCRRVREEITSMKPTERILFIKTLKELASSSTLEAQYSKLVNMHRDLFYTGLHEKAHFLPWHRWFLLQFENLLRKIDCRVTIPYWDWARVSQTYWRGSYIRDIWNPGPHGLGGDGAPRTSCVHDGPFKKGHWFVKSQTHTGCLRRQFNKEVHPKDSRYILMVVSSSFDQFEMRMRGPLHGDIHCLIGGTMCTNASSRTPEFWLHHAFLDKLWSDFQDRSAAHKYAYYPSLSAVMPGCHKHPTDFLDTGNLPGGARVFYRPSAPYDQPLDPNQELNSDVNDPSSRSLK